MLDVARLRSRVPGCAVHYFDSTSSTMTEASRLAAAGAAHGTAVIAREQTVGQGRHGHGWHSAPDGGLYLSVILRLPFAAASFPALTLALGLAARNAVREAAGVVCDLRWPNDLLIDDRKCAGILVRQEGSAAIAGFGVNVNQTAFPAELAATATSLRLATGREHALDEVAAALLVETGRYAAHSADGDHAGILGAFAAASSYVEGRRVTVEQDGAAITGTTWGLDAQGFLLVRQDSGDIIRVLTGGVRPAG